MVTIPSLPANTDPKVKRAFKLLVDAINTTTKAAASAASTATAAASAASSIVTVNYPVPVALTGLVVTGLYNQIALTWDGYVADGFAHVEIWRAESDNLGVAELVGTTSAAMYADSPPDQSLSRTYYYWIRAVNRNDPPDYGPYNATAGEAGSTADNPEYLMDVLSDAFGDTSDSPFFQIDTPTEINGVTVPAGTYLKTAFIYEAFITSAMIESLAADKILAGTITAVLELIAPVLKNAQSGATAILDMSLSSPYLKMVDGVGNYVQMTPGGFKFVKNGSANPIFEFNGSAAIMRDDDGTILLQSGGNIDISRVFGAGDLAALDSLAYTALTGTKPPTDADKTADNPQSPSWLSSDVVWSNNKISSANIGTYMGLAAITNAYIGTAAIKSANIETGTIQKLDITGTASLNGQQLAVTNTIVISVPTATEYEWGRENGEASYAHGLGRYVIAIRVAGSWTGVSGISTTHIYVENSYTLGAQSITVTYI